jgi:hypothetical protein
MVKNGLFPISKQVDGTTIELVRKNTLLSPLLTHFGKLVAFSFRLTSSGTSLVMLGCMA